MKKLPVLLLALVVALSAGQVADAKKKKSFCKRAVAAQKGKVKKRTGGVTIYTVGRTFQACSEKFRKDVAMYSPDDGLSFAGAKAAKSRCMVIHMAGSNPISELAFKDLKSKAIGTQIRQVGYGAASGKVHNLRIASNCGTAWGEAVSDGTTTSYALYARSVGPLSSLPEGQTIPLGPVASVAELNSMRVKPSGKGMKVTWTANGVAQTKILPEPRRR